jgi:hypothetical protein
MNIKGMNKNGILTAIATVGVDPNVFIPATVFKTLKRGGLDDLNIPGVIRRDITGRADPTDPDNDWVLAKDHIRDHDAWVTSLSNDDLLDIWYRIPDDFKNFSTPGKNIINKFGGV